MKHVRGIKVYRLLTLILLNITYLCSECHLNLNMCTLRIKGGPSKELCIYSTLVHLNSSIEINVCCLKHQIYLQASLLIKHNVDDVDDEDEGDCESKSCLCARAGWWCRMATDSLLVTLLYVVIFLLYNLL